jgi:hypothetical protein
MAGQAIIVANGTDDIFDVIHNFWGTSVEDRAAPLLQQAGYQVLEFQVSSSIDVWRALGGLTYPYQAKITLETGALPNTVPAITKSISDALVQATGYAPNSIAVTSAGQTAPAAPAGPVDRVLGSVEGITQTALGGVQIITAAIVIGVVALIYFVAKNPKAGRGLL